MTVLIAAGGTGGHVVPGLAVAEALKARRVPVIWAGTATGLEARLVPDAGVPLSLINVRGLRGQSLIDTVSGPFRLVGAIVQSIRLLRQQRVSAVLGMGGFVSGPVAIAALLLRIPLVLHEQNAVPGMTNAKLARFATRVFSAFPGAFPDAIHNKPMVEVVGNPVPQSIVAQAEASRAAATDQAVQILVVGGSRGAEFLNTILPEAMALRTAESRPVKVMHQAGAGRGEATRDRYQASHDQIVVSDFIDDMASAYRQADLVISRAGAMTVTELAASGTPSLLVPYPFAVDDHQTANANWLVKAGGAVLLPQSELTATRLATLIDELAIDRPRLQAMASAAHQQYVPGAAARVADALIDVAGLARSGASDVETRSSDNTDASVDQRQPVTGGAH